MVEASSNSCDLTDDGVSSRSAPQVPVWKRTLDLVCIFLALPALAPMLCVIAGAIKWVSRGPIFFRQTRIGHLGKPFTCLKFRTMHLNADCQIHRDYFRELMQSQKPMTKLDAYGDPRLIRFGAFLRSTGLDELPQVFNVLGGDMSLVGPRPCTPNEYEDYLPWQRQRFATAPGLTGLWQVSGKNRTTFNEMIQMDIVYIQRRSLWLDLAIMMKTFPVLFSQAKEMSRAKRQSASSVSGTQDSVAAASQSGGGATSQDAADARGVACTAAPAEGLFIGRPASRR
jgi:exopolysaccharide production protein ExoY